MGSIWIMKLKKQDLLAIFLFPASIDPVVIERNLT